MSEVVKDNGPLPVDKAVSCVLQTARGLEYAHSKGIVHRDIKPANLLLDNVGAVKILDMGLARLESSAADPEQAELTGTGQIMGTVDYMAPEQAVSTKSADARSDVYSLGITLWDLMTGKAAYDGETLMAKLLAHREAPVPSLSAVCPDVSAKLNAVFARMVAKTPADRYQSMSEVLFDLENCLAPTSAPILTPTSSENSKLNAFLMGMAGQSTAVAAKNNETRQSNSSEELAATIKVDSADLDTDPQIQTARPESQLPRKGRRPLRWRDWRILSGSSLVGALLVAFLLIGVTGNSPTDKSRGNVEPQGNRSSLPAESGVNFALEFDGKSSYVHIAKLKYELNSPITIEARVKLSANAKGIGVVLHAHTVAGAAVYFDKRGERSLMAQAWSFRYPGIANDFASSKTVAIPERWTHLAQVWDGRTRYVFVDGQLIASMAIDRSPWPAEFQAFIGMHFTNDLNKGLLFFKGAIDEVRISQVARYTDDFIPQLRFKKDEHSLALYHFDEGSGSILHDSSGSGSHGKIQGAKWLRIHGQQTSGK